MTETRYTDGQTILGTGSDCPVGWRAATADEIALADQQRNNAVRLVTINNRIREIDMEYGPRYLREQTIKQPGPDLHPTALQKLIAAETEASALRTEARYL